MSLKKNFYKCLSVTENKKKNGEPYLFLRLENKDSIIDGYMWENIDIYKDIVFEDGVYAIKYQIDTFNRSSVLNIKNLSLVEGSRYRKYGYNKSMVTMSPSNKNDFYLTEISKFILSRGDRSLTALNDFIVTNKRKILLTRLVESKYLTLRYFDMVEKTLTSKADSKLFIHIIVFHGLSLDINSFLEKLNANSRLYDGLALYVNNNKGFIKKYKFIVDFIDDNLKNYINLKKESNKNDGKE